MSLLDPTQQASPPDLLLNLIIVRLAPLFLEVAGHDEALARAAALDTINDYRSRCGDDLLLVAQVIAFSLASLSTVVASMQPDLSAENRNRAQARANMLARTAERQLAARNGRRPPVPRQKPPPPSDRFTQLARDIAAGLADLPVPDRQGCDQAGPDNRGFDVTGPEPLGSISPGPSHPEPASSLDLLLQQASQGRPPTSPPASSASFPAGPPWARKPDRPLGDPSMLRPLPPHRSAAQSASARADPDTASAAAPHSG